MTVVVHTRQVGAGAGDAPAGTVSWREQLASGFAALALNWRAAAASSAGLVVLAVLGGAAPPAAAWCTKLLLDQLQRGRAADVRLAVGYAVAAALLAGVTAVVAQVGFLVKEYGNRSVTRRVERELADRIGGFPGLRYFEDPAFHGRLRLAGQAAQSAPGDVSDFAVELVRRAVAMGGFLGVLAAVWPPMSLLLVAAAVPAFATQLSLARRQAQTREQVTEVQRRQQYYRMLLTNEVAAKEARLFGFGPLFRDRMLAALTASTGAELRVRRRATLAQSGFALLDAAICAVGVAVVVAGAVRGTVSLGDVTLFVAAIASLQSAFAGLIMQVARVSTTLRLFGHYRRLLLAGPDLPDGTESVPRLRSGIEFRDVWFRYQPDAQWVLQGVSFTIPAGSSAGLVGVNGAGKSTLVKLLCRFYDPTRGAIFWDGVDIRELRVAELRKRLSAVFQDFMVYDLTVAENIGLGDLDRLDDLDAVRRAAVAAEVDGKISALPRGYQTLISRTFADTAPGAVGTMLSGGERQRLVVARSLLRTDADVLVLDEPSAGLDAAAEYQLNRTLQEHRAGRTCLLISHRLSALRDADLILVLAGGRVVESGGHDALMTAGGEYARLFGLQAERYQDPRVAAP